MTLERVTESRYTFGHSTLAAERLERVAATFEPTSRALLEQVRPHLTRCRRVADLGDRVAAQALPECGDRGGGGVP